MELYTRKQEEAVTKVRVLSLVSVLSSWTGLTECSDNGGCAHVSVSEADVVWTWRIPYFSQPSSIRWFCPLCVLYHLFVVSCR